MIMIYLFFQYVNYINIVQTVLLNKLYP